MTLPFVVPQWHPDPQEYARNIQRANHDQALAHFGEYTIFVLMWRLEDFNAGLVTRCSTCYTAYGKVADAYGQSSQEKCSACYGTTFEGGIKARIARLALWDMQEQENRSQQRRGNETTNNARVQSASDFRLRTNDFAFRGDGTRWRIQSIDTDHLRTGFQMPSNVRTPLGYAFGQVVLESTASVAYDIPPDEATLADLDLYRIMTPADLSSLEVVNGDLLHEDV